MLPYRPKLIVASLLTTEGIWADVLNLGGYDVLVRPLNQEEALHSIGMAWLAWKHDAEREAARLEKASRLPMPQISSETSRRDVQWRSAAR